MAHEVENHNDSCTKGDVSPGRARKEVWTQEAVFWGHQGLVHGRSHSTRPLGGPHGWRLLAPMLHFQLLQKLRLSNNWH